MFDGWYPLRWCLFVEPVNVYRETTVRLEAVLANEDMLPPGEYPVRLQVVGPAAKCVFDRTITVNDSRPEGKPEPPFAMPVFAEDVVIDGPPGKYRFLATFERGAAAAGGETEFYVADPAEMPTVEAEVVLWGDDPELAEWLKEHGIRTRPFASTRRRARVILAAALRQRPAAQRRSANWPSASPAAPRSSSSHRPSSPRQISRPPGCRLAKKGSLTALPSWLYHKDEWAKTHPIFDGLPAGGLMDYTFYREIISDVAWTGQDTPAEVVAGATNTSIDYSAGLTVSVHTLGAGQFILNSLLIRENLGPTRWPTVCC